MDEKISTEVVTDDISKNGESNLEIINDGNDVLTFKLNGKVIFSGDWENNFKKVFKRALELWD